ncbi:MAG TPA: hypothetical protein VNB94_05680 [Mycobacteriales bacterium]|nr:hypothetical protein [Mycobacteriales bacterium]
MVTPRKALTRGSIPATVAVGVGVLAVGVGVVRRLPLRAASLPFSAAGGVARLKATLLQEYAGLAHRGETVIGRLRGTENPVTLDVSEAAGSAQTIESVLDPFALGEPVTELVDDAAPGATLAHSELPLEDYDHLTLGSLRARIRKLDAPELIQLRDYERAHANRLPVLVAFDNRLKSLAGSAPGAAQARIVIA